MTDLEWADIQFQAAFRELELAKSLGYSEYEEGLVYDRVIFYKKEIERIKNHKQ